MATDSTVTDDVEHFTCIVIVQRLNHEGLCGRNAVLLQSILCHVHEVPNIISEIS